MRRALCAALRAPCFRLCVKSVTRTPACSVSTLYSPLNSAEVPPDTRADKWTSQACAHTRLVASGAAAPRDAKAGKALPVEAPVNQRAGDPPAQRASENLRGDAPCGPVHEFVVLRRLRVRGERRRRNHDHLAAAGAGARESVSVSGEGRAKVG